MRLYSSFIGPKNRLPVLVRDGFSWWGLLFGWLVLLRPGAWLCAALAGIATLLIGLLARAVPGCWALLPGLNLAIALFVADWRCWELKQAGFVAGPMVAGASRGQALLRLLHLRPELVGPAA